LTSPEVGSLFGMCVARAVDRLWQALDEPDPFLVVEAGAGNGRLARDVLRAEPACRNALRYVLVERSAQLRAAQRKRLALEPVDEALGPFVAARGEDRPAPASGAGPVATSLDELPALAATDVVVLANELFDNLPFGIAQWDGERWLEVRVRLAGEHGFEEVLVPAEFTLPYDVPAGTRVPVPTGMARWFEACDALVHRGFVIVIDYAAELDELATRPWLRTYRAHGPGGDPLDAPGTQDITADVVVEQLEHVAPFRLVRTESQADWLRALGIEELVDAGRTTWEQGAHRGDLAALEGRSRITEARALTDPGGLGAHRVFLFAKDAEAGETGGGTG
jgi:SAM-dependent MidA family methyltransferase